MWWITSRKNKKKPQSRINREFMLVNETPHYPISFVSTDHLLNMSEKDTNITHPLGEVYMSKNTHSDNNARIVVINGGIKPSGEIAGFVFNKVKWNNRKNPFADKYNQSVESRVIEYFNEIIFKPISSNNGK